MRISVTMPAYNVEPLVAGAVRSVLDQQVSVPFELLICENGSEDATWEVLRSFRDHPAVRLFRNPEKGLGRARQRLLEAARGEHLAICDADDELLPGTLERFSRILEARPEVGVVYGDSLTVETDTRGIELGPRRRLSHARERGWDLMRNDVPNPGTMFRTALAREVGGYRDLPVCEDWDLWLRLAEVTRFHYEQQHVCCLYRRRPGTASTIRGPVFEQVITRIVQDAVARRYPSSSQ